jgi:hypothetical protein
MDAHRTIGGAGAGGCGCVQGDDEAEAKCKSVCDDAADSKEAITSRSRAPSSSSSSSVRGGGCVSSFSENVSLKRPDAVLPNCLPPHPLPPVVLDDFYSDTLFFPW